MCEAAQTAKRHPGFAASHQAITRRRGKQTATTAIARKLLARACHLLTDTHITAPRPPRRAGAPAGPEGPPSPGRARVTA